MGKLATRCELRSTRQSIVYRSIRIEGLDIFYREAGSADAPT